MPNRRKSYYQPKTTSHKRKIRSSCRAYADRVRRALALLNRYEQQHLGEVGQDGHATK